MNTDRGFLYVTSAGDSHYEECLRSATQVNEIMPNTPICLVTDNNVTEDIFDQVIITDLDAEFRDKPNSLRHSPFSKTIYLDTDTYVTSSLDDMFELLDSYKMAAAIAAERETTELPIPFSYPEYCTGVVAFRDDDAVSEFFEDWIANHERLEANSSTVLGDKASFRKTAFESSLQVHTLPSEYNTRSRFAGYLKGRAKILHARHPDPSKVASRLNRRQGSMRVFISEGEHDSRITVYAMDKKPLSLLVKSNIKKNGFAGTAYKATKRLPRLVRHYIAPFRSN